MDIFSTSNLPNILNPTNDTSLEIVNAIAGKLLILKNDAVVSRNIRELGHWAWEHVEIFKALIPSDGTFVDVGSYIGHHSVAILNHLKGKGQVIAIEGQPQIATICANNLLSQSFPNWKVFVSLIGESKKSYKIPIEDFTQSLNFGSLSLIAPQVEFGVQFIDADSESLDNILLDLTSIDLVKLDVQYAELFALKGFEQSIIKHKPSLFVEIAPGKMLNMANYDYRSIYNLLTSLGYRLFDVLGKPIDLGRNRHPNVYPEDLEWDLIAIHETRMALLKNIPWIV